MIATRTCSPLPASARCGNVLVTSSAAACHCPGPEAGTVLTGTPPSRAPRLTETRPPLRPPRRRPLTRLTVGRAVYRLARMRRATRRRLGPSEAGPGITRSATRRKRTTMRKLIESTLVSLDGVIEVPERWASSDAEATALSIKELGNYDAFVSWPGHLREVLRELGPYRWQPIHRPHHRHAFVIAASRPPTKIGWNATLLWPDPSSAIARLQRLQPAASPSPCSRPAVLTTPLLRRTT